MLWVLNYEKYFPRLQKDLDAVEDKERDTFLELSAAMRDSYEKERARVERTKNWSLIGTIIGTLVGKLTHWNTITNV